MPEYGSNQRHPFLSLILLLLLMIAGTIVFTILAAALGASFYGLKDLMQVFGGNFTANLNLTKLIQIVSTPGTFIIPALLLARFESKRWANYLSLRNPPALLMVLTLLVMLISTPFIQWTVEFNQQMKLPGFLKFMEDWMRKQEDQLAGLTRQLLTMRSPGALLVNMLMLAVLPALGEELVFRGCLQKNLARWTRNHHAAIWISAILFSAIHMQFYGFIPRMLLGAMFGYLLLWSNSLWVPVFAHFINNSVAVITAYVYQQKGLPMDKLDQPETAAWYIYLISFAGTALILWFFYRQTQNNRQTYVH